MSRVAARPSQTLTSLRPESVLGSPFLTQRPAVPAFEHAVAAHVGPAHAVAVNSATSTLHLGCLALGLGPGDRLWTTSIMFVASANCGRDCDTEVGFLGIDPATALMSVVDLEHKLEQAARTRTLSKVLVPVHLCGTSCDTAAIAALAQGYGVAVVEDVSHAGVALCQNELVGNCLYSAISV